MTVIVTGSSGAIGKAIADAFEGIGKEVFRVDKHNYDLTDEKWTRTLAWTARPPFETLVNAAGVSIESYYGDMDAWDRTFAVNVRAVYFLCSRLKGEMPPGSSIINITSANAEVATPNNPAYIASKGALKMLTKAMALDFAKYGIRVNNVCPGYIHTAMTERSYNDPEKNKLRAEKSIMNRWGQPEEIAKACLFLASDAASFITGADIVVDGGWLAKG